MNPARTSPLPDQPEHYLPLRRRDLLESLVKDLPAETATSFRQLAELLAAHFHFEGQRLLEELKDCYAPFDPDAIGNPPTLLSEGERDARLDRFCTGFAQLLQRANFIHLDKAAIQEVTRQVSDWGLHMDVDFNLFERLDVYYRGGDKISRRTRRRWRRLLRQEMVDLPVFSRLVLLVKLRPSPRLPSDVDTSDLFIKLFKDVPKMDAEMLLPGARMVMPGLARLKMGGSFISGLIYVVYSVLKTILTAGLVLSIYALWVPLAALFGYGYRQYYGYKTTKDQFSLRLTQSLYYQMLGTNLGVVHHLLDEAEEQENREALLAWFHLSRGAAEGMTLEELDAAVETDLAAGAGIQFDFEADDALAKLKRLNLVEQDGDRYRTIPIQEALRRLDEAWDGFFRFNS